MNFAAARIEISGEKLLYDQQRYCSSKVISGSIFGLTWETLPFRKDYRPGTR